MEQDVEVLQRLLQGGPDAHSISPGADHICLIPQVKLFTPAICYTSFRSSKMEAIRNKYRGVKFMKVADLPELKGEVCLE